MGVMRCPICGAERSTVVHTLKKGLAVLRVRECEGPGHHHFNTTELPVKVEEGD